MNVFDALACPCLRWRAAKRTAGGASQDPAKDAILMKAVAAHEFQELVALGKELQADAAFLATDGLHPRAIAGAGATRELL
jgi:hypothetical protein